VSAVPGSGTAHYGGAGAAYPAGAVPPGWRRLSPRMLLVHPVQEVLRAFPALVGVFLAGSGSGNGERWSLLGVAVAVALGLTRWFTTSYRVGADQVQVRRGLLNRRVLSVPRDRVRTVDVTAHALHRVLGLARVTVGTGLSDRKDHHDLRLDALTGAEAARLRVELLHRGTPQQMPAPTAAAAGTELVALRPQWVRYAPFTLSGLVTVGVLGGFASHTLDEAHIDPGRFGPLRALGVQLSRLPLWLAGTEVAVGLVAAATAASTAGYVLAFWRFRLTRQPEGTLHVTRGLVTARATTLEERRLRGVEISEPLLLRIVRGARCQAIATGLRVGRGEERGGSLLLPPAPLAEARRVAAAVLGRAGPVHAPLLPHGPRAARRRYSRALTGAAVLVGAAAVAGWWLDLAFLPVVALAAFPVAAALAADRCRSLGHTLVEGTLVTRWGSLVRRRCALATDGIIGWNLRQSFFQRRAGLLTLTATTAAGRQHYPVADVPAGDAVRLADGALPGLLTPFLR
jgi:putative membrane protein